jgi:hypothetical protein
MKSFSWSPKENILAYWVAEDKVGCYPDLLWESVPVLKNRSLV